MSSRQNSMMAMLDGKSEDKGNGEYWNDTNEHLSPVRKHLISTYLQVPEDEAMPLLGEYFGVALSFMALGALVRASNSTKKKQKRASDEERLDLRSCSRFQRMALESMLREAMERLRNLSQNAYHLEEKARDLVADNVALDKERVQLLKRLAVAEKSVQELRGLRKAEGRANERVMCIVAAKEQDWLKEKRNLQKEIDKLKETVSGMTREAKFQARRCRNPNCEHCKGIDRVVRNVKSRISLRELSFRESQASAKREVPRVDRQLEVEEDRVLIKAIEHKKKQNEQPGHLKNQNKVEKHVEWLESASSSRIPYSGSAGSTGQSMTKELLSKHQDMESELANILKRVGMLKQRSNSSNTTTTKKERTPVEERKLYVDDKEVTELSKDQDLPYREDRVEVQGFITRNAKVDNIPTVKVRHLLSAQEHYASFEDEGGADLLELEKAFELKNGEEICTSQEESRIISDRAVGSVEIQPELESEEVIPDNLLELKKAFELKNGEEICTLQEESRIISDGAVGSAEIQPEFECEEVSPENLLELEKAFELKNGEETCISQESTDCAVGSAVIQPQLECEGVIPENLSELEKAFELKNGEETCTSLEESHIISDGAVGSAEIQPELGSEEVNPDNLLELEKTFELKNREETCTSQEESRIISDGAVSSAEIQSELESEVVIPDNLLELEKAFELKNGEETCTKQEESRIIADGAVGSAEMQPELESEEVIISDGAVGSAQMQPELESEEVIPDRENRMSIDADKQQRLLDEDAEFAVFERSLNLERGLGLGEFESKELYESLSNEAPKVVETHMEMAASEMCSVAS